MAPKSLKVLVLFDLSYAPPKDQDYTSLIKGDEFETEADVSRALQKLGHQPKLFGIYDDVQPLIEELHAHRPDMVFNLCESVYAERRYEPNIAALLELERIPFTGSGSPALQICKDKGLAKKILSYHRIRVPRFVVSSKTNPLQKLRSFHFPTFTKPLGLEASEGIAQLSLSENEKDCVNRIRFLHDRFEADVIVEEYIDGRELYVSIIGNERLTVFPPRELFFKEVPDDEPKFATFKAKWDKAYRKKWGIRSGPAKAMPEKSLDRMVDLCKKIYKLFGIRGYARMDLRLTPEGEIVFIEANPNPSIAMSEDFSLSAKKDGWEYTDLMEKITNLAI